MDDCYEDRNIGGGNENGDGPNFNGAKKYNKSFITSWK
jgi:hypothetical protein